MTKRLRDLQMEKNRGRNDRGLVPKSRKGPPPEHTPGEEVRMMKFQRCDGEWRYWDATLMTGGW